MSTKPQLVALRDAGRVLSAQAVSGCSQLSTTPLKVFNCAKPAAVAPNHQFSMRVVAGAGLAKPPVLERFGKPLARGPASGRRPQASATRHHPAGSVSWISDESLPEPQRGLSAPICAQSPFPHPSGPRLPYFLPVDPSNHMRSPVVRPPLRTRPPNLTGPAHRLPTLGTHCSYLNSLWHNIRLTVNPRQHCVRFAMRLPTRIVRRCWHGLHHFTFCIMGAKPIFRLGCSRTV